MKLQHPLTWWLWSIGVISAVITADNALFALACLVGAATLVKTLAGNDPWVHSFWFALKLGGFIMVIRAITGIFIGVPIPGTELFKVPILPLPDWIAGIRIGGIVTQERLLSSLHEGIIITTVICLFGVAVSLTSPHRLLRVLPVFIYEFGVALVIATSALPQLVTSAARIRRARILRGDEHPSWRKIALPLLEESLARSLELAAAMDSRGYGVSKSRSRYRPIAWKLSDSAIAASGLLLFLSVWISQ